jgi:outer membrane protein assembly factor BamB
LLGCIVGLLITAGGCGKGKQAPPKADAPLPLQSFSRQWATDLQLRGEDLTSLHVRETSVFAYTRTGRVASLGRESGNIQYWVTVKGGTTALHAPVVIDERLAFRRPIRATKYKEEAQWEAVDANPVVFPTATTFEVYNRVDGQFVTSVDIKSAIRSGAVGRAGTVYVGNATRGGARGAAIDITQPYSPVRWEVMFPHGSISAAPALKGDAVYFAGEDGSVIAVTAADRTPIWPLAGGAFKTGGPVSADLAADDETLYVASSDSKLYALNRLNGRIRWQFYATAALRDAPVVTSDMVYQYDRGAGLAALSKATGEFNRRPLWVAQDCTRMLAQDDRNAYLRRRDGAIVARDKKTGEVRFTSHQKFNVFATNTLKEDGMIYAATKAGRILAIRPILKPGMVGEVVRLETQELGAEVVAAAK